VGAGGGLGGPAHTDVNFGGKKTNLGAAPHDWGFAKKRVSFLLASQGQTPCAHHTYTGLLQYGVQYGVR